MNRNTNLLVAVILIILCLDIHAQRLSISSNPAIGINCSKLSSANNTITKDWLRQNTHYTQHPDAGKTDNFKPSATAIELIEKRTKDTKFYVDNDSTNKFYSIQSLGAIHYRKDGQWITIDERLQEIGNRQYEASRQEEPVGFDISRQKSYIKSLQGTVSFNNWNLYGKVKNETVLLAKANWSNYSVGDEGVYITDVFPGIDLQMKAGRGTIKTNFIIRELKFGQATELIFKDIFDCLHKIDFISHLNEQGAGIEADLIIDNINAIHIDRAIAYQQNDAENTRNQLFYTIDGDTLSMSVDMKYLKKQIKNGVIVIDPLVSTTNSIAQMDITGSMDCGSLSNLCNYTLQVPTPAKTTITGIYFKFGFQTANGALNRNGYWTITPSNCNNRVIFGANPDSAAYNTPGTTTTRGQFANITSYFLSCMPAPSCTSQNVAFTLGFFNNICDGIHKTCSENYIKAEEPFVVMLEGHTVEVDSITPSSTICKGNKVTLTATGKYGVPGYTYSWNNGAGTGSTVIVQPTTTTTYTVTITDQCGNSATGTVIVTVNTTTPPTISSVNSNSPVCEGNSITLNAASASSGVSYSWTGPNGFTSNLQNPTIPNATQSNAGKYIVTCYNNSCYSNSDTVTVEVNSSTAAVNIQASTSLICSNNLVTFTATPNNGGTSPTYQWKVNGISVGENTNTYSSKILNDGDVVTCQMTSSAPCVSPATVISNSITMSAAAPTVDSIPNITVINGATVPAIGFYGTGNLYSWTCDNPAIGISANGTDSIPTFKAVNTRTSPITATVTVTPNIANEELYVSCVGNNTVLAINPFTYQVDATIPVGNWPLKMLYNSNNGQLYVVNHWSYTISAINTSTNTVLSTIPVGQQPYDITISPDYSKLYVVNMGANSVSVINTSTNSVIATIPVGSNPKNLVISPDGKLLYVANQSSNTISVVDAINFNLIKNININRGPSSMKISRDGQKLYVIANTNNTLQIINTKTNTITSTIPTGGDPQEILLSKDERKSYVTNYTSSSVSAINITTGNALSAIGVETSPQKLTSNADYSKIYVANYSSNSVSVINTSTDSVIANIRVGTNPYTIIYQPSRKNILVANSQDNTVSVINAGTDSKTTTIKVNNDPWDLILAKVKTPCSSAPKSFTITVNPTITPSANISASATTICSNEIVTFKATPTNGGSSPTYQWKINGTTVGTNSDSLITGVLNNNDTVYCVMTSNASGASPATVTSNKIIMSVKKATSSVTKKTICASDAPYTWNSLSCNTTGIYSVHLTNTVGCDSTATLELTVNPIPTLNQPSNIITYNGNLINRILFSGTGKSYLWTCDNATIGLSANGTDSIPAFTAINTGTSPVIANVTVTPTLGNGYIYVPTSGNNVLAINANNYNLTSTISLSSISKAPDNPSFAPKQAEGINAVFVTLSPDGSRAYVTNTIYAYAINTITKKTIALFKTGDTPTGIAVSPDGTRVYVANTNSNTISVINATTNIIINSFSVGDSPERLLLSPDGTKLYITSLFSKMLTVVNTTTNSLITSKITNNYLQGIAISPDGSKLYANNSNNTLEILDANTLNTLSTINVGNSPSGIALSPDGNTVYVANSGSGTISVINTTTKAVVATISFIKTATELALSPDGNYLYATNSSAGTISVISTLSNSIVTTIATGSSALFGIATSPNYSSCAGSSKSFTITVNPTAATAINIVSSATTICSNETVTFKATSSNAGTNPSYQWKINGINVGSNSDSLCYTGLNNKDTVYCVMTYNTSGTSPVTITSNKIILTVRRTTASTTDISINKGQSYTFNGKVYTISGTYSVHLTNAAGCDSIATLILTVNNSSTSTTKISICQGDSYTFNGKTYTTSGTYTAKLTNSDGADSTAILILTVSQPTTSITKAAICEGDGYRFNGKLYTATGTYIEKLTNCTGCDSTATLQLTVNQPTYATIKTSICNGDSYSIGNNSFNTAGTYTVHLTNAAGCDSIVTLTLNINKTSYSITRVTICYGENYTFNNNTYNDSGTYNTKLKNSVGCDSIATLILTVNQPTSSTTTVSVCKGNGYTFNGKTYFDSGKYVYKLPNKAGCDSLATLVLNVKSPASSTITESICSGESYLFNGKNYTKSGTYSTSYALATGCDSTVTLHLNVSPDYASNQNITLVNDEKYTINGHTYYTEGIYVDVLKTKGGCDSTVTTTIKTLLIPNTLSPNGDGTNDIFMTGYKVRIYNRNGIMMYEGNNGWNGTHNGKRVENDTYFYELSLPGTSIKKRGYLTITG